MVGVSCLAMVGMAMSLAAALGGAGAISEPWSLSSPGIDTTVEAAPNEHRSKLASEAPPWGLPAFSLDEVVASSSSIDGQDGVDSSILLSRSFKAFNAICRLLSASSAFVPGRLTVMEPEGAAILYRWTCFLQILRVMRRLKIELDATATIGVIGSGKKVAKAK